MGTGGLNSQTIYPVALGDLESRSMKKGEYELIVAGVATACNLDGWVYRRMRHPRFGVCKMKTYSYEYLSLGFKWVDLIWGLCGDVWDTELSIWIKWRLFLLFEHYVNGLQMTIETCVLPCYVLGRALGSRSGLKPQVYIPTLSYQVASRAWVKKMCISRVCHSNRSSMPTKWK